PVRLSRFVTVPLISLSWVVLAAIHPTILAAWLLRQTSSCFLSPRVLEPRHRSGLAPPRRRRELRSIGSKWQSSRNHPWRGILPVRPARPPPGSCVGPRGILQRDRACRYL